MSMASWTSPFVSARTFEALARREAARELYPHLIEADLLVVAPLSANTLAKLAHGLADNVLTQTALAFEGQLLVAPAMNPRMWRSPATRANVAWARDAYGALAPHFTAGRYVNYLNADEVGEEAAISAAFGPNWKRLREIKRKYDPDNVFHLNQNIKP